MCNHLPKFKCWQQTLNHTNLKTFKAFCGAKINTSVSYIWPVSVTVSLCVRALSVGQARVSCTLFA